MAKRVKIGHRASISRESILTGKEEIIMSESRDGMYFDCPNCGEILDIENREEEIECYCYMEFKRTSEDSFRVNPDYYFAR